MAVRHALLIITSWPSTCNFAIMSYIKVGKENSRDIELHYQDYGQGKPAILIHGYPQNGAAWEKQIPVLIEAGYRVITYDRRGFGESTKPLSGYDWDTFATDLNQVINHLNLTGITLIGHSMGTGEITLDRAPDLGQPNLIYV